MHEKHNGLGKAWLALAGVFAFAASPCWAAAQQAAPPAAPQAAGQPQQDAPKLDELDEVVVNGTRLYDRIVRAEDRFFKLYNELNKEDDFDTNCAFVPIDQDSRIEQRFCMPSFFADAKAEQVRLNAYCQSLIVKDDDGNVTAQGPCYQPASAEQIFFQRRDAYVDNMLEVINDNPDLKKMALEVEALHRERAGLAKRYDEIKAQRVLDSSEKNKTRPTVR